MVTLDTTTILRIQELLLQPLTLMAMVPALVTEVVLAEVLVEVLAVALVLVEILKNQQSQMSQKLLSQR
jgi:hypothetical protein